MILERRRRPQPTGIDLAEIAGDRNDPDDDRTPVVGTYRGVELHDAQSPQRLAVVKRAIRRVLRLASPSKLVSYLQDASNPPACRLLAARKVEELVATGRAQRAPRVIDIEGVRAAVAGLDSRKWRDPIKYTSLLDADYQHAVRREKPLADEWP
jgi:hypothetical protein